MKAPTGSSTTGSSTTSARPGTHARRLSIAVVGGSISGCLVARLLLGAGHNVQVYERSPTGLVGRGGGVATSNKVLARLKTEGLVGPEFPSVPHSHLRLGKRTDGHEPLGRCPWRPELDMECLHWSGLFRALRQGMDDSHYHLGHELVSVDHASDAVHLHFSDGSKTTADLVVFTDGFRSSGRRLMYPQVELDYRGFSVWRGVLEEAHCKTGEALMDHPRLSMASMPGSFVTYLMPSESGSVKPGERVINWAAYLPVSEEELPAHMLDREGRRRAGTIPAGAFPLAEEQRLKALMHKQLPGAYADIVAASVDTQFQPVRISRVPSHYRDRLCLVGDAAVAIQPLTGSGVFKAFENAYSLLQTLEQCDLAHAGFESALQHWSSRQVELDDRLLATGFELEQAFIWNTIDLAIATDEQVQSWWQESVHFPDDYSYLKAG